MKTSLLAALLAFALPAFAGDGLKVLAIGNSFSVCLKRYLPSAAKAAGKNLEFCNLYIGGCSLETHAANVRKGDKATPYGVVWFKSGATNAASFRSNIPQMLATQKWDVVTIQQASHFSWDPESYHPWSGELVAAIRKLAPQAEIVVQETWSYHPSCPRLAKWKMDNDEMYRRLEAAYLALAATNHFRVIPVGLAVQMYRKESPVRFVPPTGKELAAMDKPPSLLGEPVGGYKVVEKKAEDGTVQKKVALGDSIHLNRRGEYLQACVWLSFLFDYDVKDLPLNPKGLASPEELALLRTCAQKAVDEAKARKWNP